MKLNRPNDLNSNVAAQKKSIKESIGHMQKEIELLFENMRSGCVYSRIVRDGNGKPIDYVVMAVNRAYEKILGLKSVNVVGLLITEIHPEIEKDTIDWIGVYGNVALTGKNWESEVYSQLVDKWMKISAFSPKKGDFVVTFEDITDRKKAERVLELGLEYEQVIANISASLVNASFRQVDELIGEGLFQISRILDSEWTIIMQFKEDHSELNITHEWMADSFEIAPKVIDGFISEKWPWLLKELNKGETLYLSSLPECLPEEAVREKDFIKRSNIKSALFTPLRIGNSVLGYFVLNTVSGFPSWQEEMQQRIALTSQIFSNALKRVHSDQKLHLAHEEIKRLNKKLESENLYLRQEIELQDSHGEIIGDSRKIRAVLEQAEKVAWTDSTVLLQGETGTGKELLARAIHRLSSRKDRAMIKVNCAALPATLMESELFGREKGAYTGALTKQIGRFELADGSTIFLDEIGDMPLEVQAKLLRVLEENEFERLGSPESVSVDVRVIAATNKDLDKVVKDGAFRKDLYYRFNVFPIHMPPLREHLEDIPQLVWSFIDEFGRAMGKRIKTIPIETMDDLQQYSWPGNVRELKNMIEKAMILNSGDVLQLRLPDHIPETAADSLSLEEIERRHIMQVLQKTNWQIKGKKGAAELLGMKPPTLYSKMSKLAIPTRHQMDDIST
jgi:transcriptional regulator with GAF, ATPase, and Fis domain